MWKGVLVRQAFKIVNYEWVVKGSFSQITYLCSSIKKKFVLLKIYATTDKRTSLFSKIGLFSLNKKKKKNQNQT